MEIVNTQLPITSERNSQYIRLLTETYPFLRTELLGRTAFQRPISTLVLGRGPRKVLYTAAHHANEWITALVLLKFAEDYGKAVQQDGTIGGVRARELEEKATIYMIPMVNPDGVDLVTGELGPADVQYRQAKEIGEKFPKIPFPAGWKSNLLGTDLNLNYPAGWLKAREIKFLQGYVEPAPRDYVGRAPLNQVETRLLAGYTRFLAPSLVLAYHSQGKEIYWKFGEYQVPGAEELGRELARVSGYRLAQVAYASGFAGFKDWFIQEFRRPGYTVEVGQGENPLPLTQFPEIYRDNVGILVQAALGMEDHDSDSPKPSVPKG